MNIPKSVRIGALRYKVHKVRSIPKSHGAGSGYIDYDEGGILLSTHSMRGRIRHTKRQLRVAFWHEIVHGILNDMKKYDLNSNERFVEGFAERISDAIDSMRFEAAVTRDSRKKK